MYLNAAAEALLGRPRTMLLGTSIWDAFPDSANASADSAHRRALAAREPVSFEAAYPEVDLWLEVRVCPSAAGYTVYLRDISAGKRAEAALREREARLRTQYQAFPLPTYTWEYRDGDFIFTDYNAAAATFASGNLAAFIGRRATNLCRPAGGARAPGPLPGLAHHASTSRYGTPLPICSSPMSGRHRIWWSCTPRI